MDKLVSGFIKRVSPRYRQLLDINARYAFHSIEDITCEVSQPMQEGTAVFDREAWLMDFIAENRAEIDVLLDYADENQQMFRAYQSELARIPTCQNKLLCKVSDYFVQSAIQNPVVDPKIAVKIKFTNHGRVVIVRHDSFEVDDIETCYVGGHISSQGMSNEIDRPEGMSLTDFHTVLADSQCACYSCGRVAADGIHLMVKDFGNGKIRVVCDDCRQNMDDFLILD